VRIGLLSDIHANADALAGVLAALSRESVSEIVSLGDIVGYNAFPMETIILLQRARAVSILGNHDLMVLGRIPPTNCGPRGRRAIEWTAAELSPAEHRFLERLPEEIHREDDLLFVHSALGDPLTRLRTADDFKEQQRRLVARFPRLHVCFTGHTHEPQVTEISSSGRVHFHHREQVALTAGSFFFVNPGSVGEPRGSDARAAYAIFDSDRSTVQFRRVGYDRSRVLRENARQRLLPAEPTSVVTRVRGLVRFAASLVTSRAS
jgi:predicted phosphodiesterase